MSAISCLKSFLLLILQIGQVLRTISARYHSLMIQALCLLLER